MLTVIVIMTSGMLLGYLLRNQEWIKKPVGVIITWVIYLLLFILGISVGTNETILDNLGKLGINALLLTTGAVAGSVIISMYTYKIFFRRDEE